MAEELEFGKENVGSLEFPIPCTCIHVHVVISCLCCCRRQVSTGASADFSSATRVAEDMVMSYGMSEEVGVRTFHGQSDPDPRSIKVVDEAINKLLNVSTRECAVFQDKLLM